jgi:hypothetical protein
MSDHPGYIAIPSDLFPWLARALDARDELIQLAGVTVAILESAGAEAAR